MHTKTNQILELLLLVIFLLTGVEITSAQQSASKLIQQSLEAMGGKQTLENLQSIRMEYLGHSYGLEQSERPTGPWLVTYTNTTTLRDLKNDRFKIDTELFFIGSDDWLQRGSIIDGNAGMQFFGERKMPLDQGSIAKAKDGWLIYPEQALLAASRSQEIRLLETTKLQGIDQQVITFTHDENKFTLYLNFHTQLPTAIEVDKPSHIDIWGEVPYRTYYSYWFLHPNGVRYPYQFDTYQAGQPYKTQLISKLEFDVALNDDDFTIPEEIRKASEQAKGSRDWRSRPLGWQLEPITEIEQDIVMIPGSWYSSIIKQEDGLVILEAPISSEYSEKVMAEAQKRYPDVPVKAVINTSDAWPHLGGIRTYVANQIPVYTLDLNKEILNRLVAANYASRPDQLEKHPHAPIYKEVKGKTVIGKGKQRIELYPINGEGAERMVMAYFPKYKLLYGSDLIQFDQQGNLWNPQYASELQQAVEREGIKVKTVFAMHVSPMDWKDLLKKLEEFTN
jgi:hypothetical protein